MPYLNLRTNQEIAPESLDKVLKSLSMGVTEALGKSEAYVMIIIETSRPMLFGGTNEATAYVELKSLGLPESETALFSKTLCELIAQELNIKPTRIYIEFSNPERHMWGWNGKTF